MDRRIKLRPATPADLDTLVRFSSAMAQETEARGLNRQRLRQGLETILRRRTHGFFRVAVAGPARNDQVVGQMMITYEWSDWRNGTFWWIQSVYVAPPWRRRGVYRAMHEAIRKEARATRGVCGLRLYVEGSNRTAQRAYSSVGMIRSPYQVFEEDFVLPISRHAKRNTVRRTPHLRRGAIP